MRVDKLIQSAAFCLVQLHNKNLVGQGSWAFEMRGHKNAAMVLFRGNLNP